MVDGKRLLGMAALLVTVALPVLAQSYGVTRPDTSGPSYGLRGINAVNSKQAGVTQPLQPVKAPENMGVIRPLPVVSAAGNEVVGQMSGSVPIVQPKAP